MKKVLCIIFGVIFVFLCGKIVYASTQNYINENETLNESVITRTLQPCEIRYNEHHNENINYYCENFNCDIKYTHDCYNNTENYCNNRRNENHHSNRHHH